MSVRTRALTLAAVFVVYAVAARLSLQFASINSSISAVWPPAGIALAAVLIFGRRVWPAILAGACLANVTNLGAFWPSVAIACGNTIEAVVGGFLVARLAGGRLAFGAVESVFRLTAAVSLVSTPISATIGVAALSIAGLAHRPDLSYNWMTWWLGDLTGTLVAAPVILLWANLTRTDVRTWTWRRGVEAVALVAALTLVAMVVFGGLYPSDVKTYPLEFLCVPFFLWAGLRLGPRETATALVVLAAISVHGTIRGFGPFQRETVNESLLLLQAYLGVMAMTSLAVAAVAAERARAEAQLVELSLTDSLTGLGNYRRLLDVLKQEMARSDRTKRSFALLVVDVNGLKPINDQFGHLAGSRVLCRVADTLRACCRETDTPTRFGGDEFAVVLTETTRDGAAILLARAAAALGSSAENPSASICGGAAEYPADGATATKLLGVADGALYLAKSARPVE